MLTASLLCPVGHESTQSLCGRRSVPCFRTRKLIPSGDPTAAEQGFGAQCILPESQQHIQFWLKR